MKSLYDRLLDQRRARPMLAKLVSFAGIGVINAMVDLAVFTVAYELLKLPLVPANVMAWLVAVSLSYVMNSMITFRTESGRSLNRGAYLSFVASGTLGVATATTTLVVLSHFVSVFAAKLLSIIVSFVVNFSMSHFVVFRTRPSDKNRAAGSDH
ncbi:GtrA family protein [Rhodopseudomonas palustris]|uniref:GtrA family protein n=2 Tax=Rhodopseudomonas palustris TaxID=1076 RepID=A0A418VK65_RHOPL|nr:GtrA family protein [Rhodopseudomonas palustris]